MEVVTETDTITTTIETTITMEAITMEETTTMEAATTTTHTTVINRQTMMIAMLQTNCLAIMGDNQDLVEEESSLLQLRVDKDTVQTMHKMQVFVQTNHSSSIW